MEAIHVQFISKFCEKMKRTLNYIVIKFNGKHNMLSDIPVVEAYLVPTDGSISHQQELSLPPPIEPSAESLEKIDKIFSDHGWPAGLRRLYHQGNSIYRKRYFILDDSSSMMRNDGMRLIGHGNKKRFYPCCRWSELKAAMQFHASLAMNCVTPTEFRFLNKGLPIQFGPTCENQSSYDILLSTLESSPSGRTPLVYHIESVVQEIRSLLPELLAVRRKVVLVIASDGEASDGDVGSALAPLQHLPVWVVIRLCTNEDNVREYCNKVDNDLELEMDVLDDLHAEAEEIYEVNPWLTYGEPLHRLREWGVNVKEIDLLDETLLSADQMKLVCIKLFAKDTNVLIQDAPEPGVNWGEFAIWLSRLIGNEKIWNPQFERLAPWVDMKILKSKYARSGSTVCSIM